jgi:flavin-dependent dehydrogenase
VDRERFDRHFIDGELKDEWDIELNSEVYDILVKPKSITVLTKVSGEEQKKHMARVVIIATGVRYELQRKLGLGVPKDYLHGVQAEFHLGQLDCTHVFVGRNLARGGFAWLVPTENGKARLGLITEKNPIGCFHRLIKDYYPDCIEGLDESLLQFKPIAQGLVSKTYGDRVLALGEAAGQVKTTTGGGIYFGLLCSEIAAQVVCERFDEGDFSKSRMASYERLWKKAIQKEILIGYYARKFCGKMSDRQIEKTLKIIQTDGFIPMLKEKGDFDWHSELVLMFMKQLPFWQAFQKKFGKSV